MAQQREIINIGALPNDGQGDPLRVAFQKINNNFANLFASDFNNSETTTTGSATNQVVWQYPASQFTQATLQVNTQNLNDQDTQNITINATLVNNSGNVKWVGHSTLFNGNACTRYNMDVFNGSVRLLVSPMLNTTLVHFISAQVTHSIGEQTPGLPIQVDGYPANNILSTESGSIIVTE